MKMSAERWAALSPVAKQSIAAKQCKRIELALIRDPILDNAAIRHRTAKYINRHRAMLARRPDKPKQFSARTLQGKSLWPCPVIDALMANGERVRMSFHTPVDRFDADRGRRLVQAVTGSSIVDATFWHNGCQVDVMDAAPKRKRAVSVARIAAIANDSACDPVQALAQIRALLAA